MTRGVLYEGDPEDLDEVPVDLMVERSDEDDLIVWATRKGAEGNASPGILLTRSQAAALARALLENGGEA